MKGRAKARAGTLPPCLQERTQGIALKLSVKSLNTTIFRSGGKALLAVQVVFEHVLSVFQECGPKMNEKFLPGESKHSFQSIAYLPIFAFTFEANFFIFWILFILLHFLKSWRQNPLLKRQQYLNCEFSLWVVFPMIYQRHLSLTSYSVRISCAI